MVKAAAGYTLQSLAQISYSNNLVCKNTIQTPGPFSMAVGIQPNQRHLREISLFPRIAQKDAEKTYLRTSAGYAGDFFFRGLRKLRRPED